MVGIRDSSRTGSPQRVDEPFLDTAKAESSAVVYHQGGGGEGEKTLTKLVFKIAA